MVAYEGGGELRRVSDEILARIVAGSYPSGLRLPAELDLATELSCGRSTIREALRHLTGVGVVQSRRGSGAKVLDFRREGTPALLPSYLFSVAAKREGGDGRDPSAAILALELLRLRSMLAAEAVRLAARYADRDSLAEARTILAGAPALEPDPVAHALNELELFRALVFASRIWPAAWLANVFWAPMRELYAVLAPSIGSVAPDFQEQMEGLLDRIERRDEAGAAEHLASWLDRVDDRLLGQLQDVLSSASGGGDR
jgi:DNA-binding FadR family transcriptional regulator